MSGYTASVPALHPSARVNQPPPYRPNGSNAPAGTQALAREVARVNGARGAPPPYSAVGPVGPYFVPLPPPRIGTLCIPIKRAGAGPQSFRTPLRNPDGTVGWALSSLSTPANCPGYMHSGAVDMMGPTPGKPLEIKEFTVRGTSIPLATYNEVSALRARFTTSVTAPATTTRLVSAGPGFTLADAVTAVALMQKAWCFEVTCGDPAVSRALAQRRFQTLQHMIYIVAICGEMGVDGKRVMYPELELRISGLPVPR